jgi:hypothetical protein
MKKVITLLAAAFLLVSIVGCSINNGNKNDQNYTNNNENTSRNEDKSKQNNQFEKEEPKNETDQIKDYFPLKKNTRYIYEGTGNEFASFDVYNDYIEGGKVQQRVNNGGTVTANVMELKDGKLIKVYSRAEAYYRENLLKETDDNQEILLMEPLKKGTKWTLPDGRVRTITDTEANINTPAGSYQAIEVTTEGTDGKTMVYYAKNMGLVKSVFISGDVEITSTLAKIEENVPLKQTVRFYYPNIDDEKLYVKTKEIDFYTNEITRKVLAEAYKEAARSGLGPVFSKNTEINSLYLNKDGHVYIDLNQAFLSEMSAGAGFEGMILQAIANTFGLYYNAERVYLTIDNKPYESGHFSMEKGDYLKVELQDAVELQ